MNPWAILVSAVVVLGLSSVFYGLLATQLAALSAAYAESSNPPRWKMLVELLRSLVVASVVAGLVAQLGVTGWLDASLLALTAWIGFPVAILAGSVLWEKVPWRLAAIHSFDWLLKLVVIALIVTVWVAPGG